MSKKLDALTRKHASVHKQIETELKRLRRDCKHKDIVRTDASGGHYLFMCLRCRTEEHGYYLHHMRFAHSRNLPATGIHEFYNLRPPGDLCRLGDRES